MAIEQRNRGGGLRALDGLLVVAVGVIGVLVAFAALSFVAGMVWELVKVLVIVGVIGGVLWLLLGRRRA